MQQYSNDQPVLSGATLCSVEVWHKNHQIMTEGQDMLANEVPVALVYNGISHVVMMCTPQALEAFAMGFSLSEGIIQSPAEIYGIEQVETLHGIEMHIELASRQFMALKLRRRAMVGRTGCGICGIDQLSAANPTLPTVPITQRVTPTLLNEALLRLQDWQSIGQQTGCTHAAAWVTPTGEIVDGYEDIGRHVAMDKLLGARSVSDWGCEGLALITSRASYEMVQKAAYCGVEILCAISAATHRAVEVAEACGITLTGFTRDNRMVIYSHAERFIR